MVLALDSWNNCSGQQAQQPTIHKIVQYSLYSLTMYINWNKIRCCHLMLNSPAKGGMRDSAFFSSKQPCEVNIERKMLGC